MAPAPHFVGTFKESVVVIIGGSASQWPRPSLKKAGTSSSDPASQRRSTAPSKASADPARVVGHIFNLSAQGKFDHLVLTSGVINSVPPEHATYKDIVAIGDARYIGTSLAVKQAAYEGGLRRDGSFVLTSAATYK
ncbi:hypothetical protein OC846_006415 [Tilletia horrida]|uniref:Uncharacterized protein n=1 Tax=Tilletia horrida TaxID=155126 RepID=A0AAN6GLP7_9BASI|nr:hypothetical protein OC846_006415 [Tilletia horrida]KAK0559848.1 hypothetical protein OC861_006507 [Tilletia horrida]